MSDFAEYHRLTPYQKQCLNATNFWRVRSGKQPIAIPPDEVIPCIMGCGSATNDEPKFVKPLLIKPIINEYIDFGNVEKPTIRKIRRAFSIYEQLAQL
jgi:hypothetical protein